jgi:hypothetical protein
MAEPNESGNEPEVETPEVPEENAELTPDEIFEESEEGAPEGETPEDASVAEEEGEEEAEAEEEEEAEAEQEPSDPEEAKRQRVERAIDAPIPQDLSKRTQERIKTLVDTTRAVTEERDQINQQFQTVVGAIQMSGTTPDQFREYLEFQTNVNSNDPAKQKSALNFVMKVAHDLATYIGEPLTFKSPLEGHADLIQDVQQGRLQLPRAEEIARLRNKQAAQAARGDVTRQNQQYTQASKQDTDNARVALNTLESRLKGNDPQFSSKRGIVINFLKQQYGAKLERLPPGQWASTFDRAYRAINLPAQPKPAPNPANKNLQPMRHGKRPAGNAGAAPKSILDAVNAGIAAASGASPDL